MNDCILGIDIGISCYSLVLLAFLLIAIHLQTTQYYEYPQQRKSFLSLCILTAFLLLSDMSTYIFNASTDRLGISVLHASNIFLFIFNPVLLPLWFWYITYELQLPRKIVRTGFIFQYILCIFNAVMVVSTPFTGYIFYYDSRNIYHRGPLFLITSLVIMLMMIYIEYIVIIYRCKIERNNMFTLITFLIIPVASTLMQVFIYGISFGLNGAALSMLILFIYVNNRSTDIDYLTGVFNRRRLDICLQQKLHAASEGSTFSAYLIGLDNFKKINDTYGHIEGDHALQNTVLILKIALPRDAFIARYDGDEFCVIMNAHNCAVLDKTAALIRKSSRQFCESHHVKYDLDFSMGYTVYDPSSPMTLNQFEKYIDDLMYSDKRSRQAVR